MKLKQFFFWAVALGFPILMSCNSHSSTKANQALMKHDSMPMTHPMGSAQQQPGNMKMVKASFTNVDPRVSAYMKALMGSYLSIKDALANGKAGEAASAGDAMVAMMKKFDLSSMTPDQKKIYDQNEDDLKENAEHIGKSSGDIEHQRSHFSMMSEDMYSLVKSFGAGMTVYHDHCPMAFHNQGAMWLSRDRDIKNPYLGKKMATCGTVEEAIQ